MSIIKNQSGFSLTEILVAVGLMGGVSLVTMKLVEDQAGNEKVIKSSAEITKAVAIIQGQLSGDQSCKNMLGGLTPTTGAGTAISILRNKVVNGNGTHFVELLSDTKNYGDFLFKPGDIRFVKIVDNASGTTSANLVINFRVRKKGVKANFTTEVNNVNDTIITKTLPIEFKADPAGAVLSCGPVLSEANELARKKFCASLDPAESDTDLLLHKGVSYWDPINKKCNLNSMDCPFGQVPKDMTSLGSVNCVPLENAIDANSLQQIFDTTEQRCPTGGFNITVGGDGRLKIVCN